MAKFFGVMKDEIDQLKIGKSAISTSVTASGRVSQSLTPVSVAAATCAEQNFTVTGLLVGDFVAITPPSITAGVAPVCARVSATNTLTVTFCNPTAGALVPPAGAYQIQVMR
ncbi:hypothetical protein D9M71_320500 [compost metagenome]